MNSLPPPRTVPQTAKALLLLTSLLLNVTSLPAQERAPGPGAAVRERRPGQEQPDFPDEIKLTDDQQARLRAINAEFGARRARWSEERMTVMTREQRAAQTEAVQKTRVGGMTRQEASDLVEKAINYTPEQKAHIARINDAVRLSYEESDKQKMALLTAEQRTTLRRLRLAQEVASSFSLPDGMAATDRQKAGLKALQEELGPKLTQLSEAEAALLTDERRAARDAALREARDNGKDRETNATALAAALNMTAAEKAQLQQIDTSLRELKSQIRDRTLALLTPAQKPELEKRGALRR